MEAGAAGRVIEPVLVRAGGPAPGADVDDEDRAANDNALRGGERILSVYRSANGVTFWVITEADRSVTTVLLPEDY